MKRTLLSSVLAVATLLVAAQCTPNTLYQDSLFGAWPDTITDFAAGEVGVFYSDTLNLIVPSDAGQISPIGAGSTIDSVAVSTVTGLPPGLGTVCNSHTTAPCTYLPTILGCALIEGTPTQAGSFPITIDVVVFATTIIGPTTIPYQFPGYDIEIGAVGLAEHVRMFTAVNNVPNPFSGTTAVQFNAAERSLVEFKVYDLLGAELHAQELIAQPGQNEVEFNGSLLQSGIYLYELRSGGDVFTGRMVLDR